MGIFNNIAADIDASEPGTVTTTATVFANAIQIHVATVADVIVMLADVAAILRDVKANNLSMPLVCAGGHDSARFSRWGHGFVCCSCGRVPLPADELHMLLTAALRQRVQVPEREAA